MKNWKKAIALALVAGLSLSACGGEPAESDQQEAEQTYTATATGIGEITVELTVAGGKITAAKVDTSNETEGYGKDLGEKLAQQLVDAQGSNIDGVSGCTVTCAAVKTAAADALAQAGITVETGAVASGVYVGSARGAKSEIKMAVEFDGEKIVNVWNLENGDTALISQNAVDTVAREIVEEQSLAVDAVAGATLSSRAALLAVGNALAQAGVNTADWMKKDETAKTAAPTEEWDVVVVGGGTAGLTAALSAKTDSSFGLTDSGLRVLVIERNGHPGGDMSYSGGYIGTPSGNPLSEATGAEMSPEEVCEAMLAANPGAAEFADPDISLNIWQRGPATIKGLMDRGFHLTVEDARVVPLGDGMMTAAFTVDPVTGYRCGDDWYDAMTGAPYEGFTLGQAVRDAGVELRLNSEVTDLVVENNVCTGVLVETADATYQVNAKKVILATGYGGWDAESVERFYPELANVMGANNPSNHSFAQKWVADQGGDVIYYPAANYIVPIYNPILRDNYEVGWLFQKGHTMWVNSDGERFFDESVIPESSLTDTGALLRTLEDGTAWMVFDSNNTEAAQYAQELMEQGVCWSGSTAAELAEKAGLPADALAQTIEAYNAACESGTDEAFGTPADFMMPLTGETLYAARIYAGSTASVPLSVYVDKDMTVTLTQGGQRIEGLLAAGGACGNLTPVTGFGAHVYEALSSGTYAGECARVALTGK